MYIGQFGKLLQNCEDCQGARRKLVVTMSKQEIVKDCANSLSKRYVRLRKRVEEL